MRWVMARVFPVPAPANTHSGVPKLLATRGYGAEVVLQGETFETPLRLAAERDRVGLVQRGVVLVVSAGRGIDHHQVLVGEVGQTDGLVQGGPALLEWGVGDEDGHERDFSPVRSAGRAGVYCCALTLDTVDA